MRDEAVQLVNPAFDLVQQQGPARPIVPHHGEFDEPLVDYHITNLQK